MNGISGISASHFTTNRHTRLRERHSLFLRKIHIFIAVLSESHSAHTRMMCQ